MNNHNQEQGAGLLEVMIALVILVAGALAAANLHTTAVGSASISAFHFSLNQLGNEAVETLRSYQREITPAGYDFDPLKEASDTTGTSTVSSSLEATMLDWNARVVMAIPTGVGLVSCSTEFCNVSISWLEEIDGNLHTQLYRIGTPL